MPRSDAAAPALAHHDAARHGAAPEPRAADHALASREARWQAMIENAHDILTILDAEGRMTYQSPSLTRVLGWRPEELIGRSAFAFMHPDDAPLVAEQIARGIVEAHGGRLWADAAPGGGARFWLALPLDRAAG